MREVNASLLAAGVALTAAGASIAGPVAFAAAILACQILLVAGWSTAGLPSAGWAGAAVAVTAGGVADALMLPRGAAPSLGFVLPVVAGAVAAAMVVHLRPGRSRGSARSGRSRRGRPKQVTAALAMTVTVSVLVVFMSALVAERAATHGRVTTVAVVVAAGVVAAVLSGPSGSGGFVPGALTLAGGVGLLAGTVAPEVGAGYLLSVCVTAGLFAVVAHEVTTFTVGGPGAGGAGSGRRGGRAAERVAAKANARRHRAGWLLGSTLPLALAAPASYLLGRLLLG
jgi:hypothetical protein